MLGHSGFGSVLGARECFGNLARPRTACFARQEQVIRWCRSAPNKRFAGVVIEIAPGPVRGWRVLCARTSESSRSLRKLFRGVVASLLAVGRALLAVGSVVASSNTASILMRPLGAQHHTGYSEVQKLPITHGKRALRLAPARRASSRRSLSLSRWRTCTGTSQSLSRALAGSDQDQFAAYDRGVACSATIVPVASPPDPSRLHLGRQFEGAGFKIPEDGTK